MATITGFPAENVISGFKGSIDYYLHHGLQCVRKWPRSPGHKRTPAVEAQWPAFTIASRLWNDLSPQIRAAYESMAKLSGLNGRDLAERAYLSGLFTYPTGHP